MSEPKKDISKCDFKKPNLQKYSKWEFLKKEPESFNDFDDYILELTVEETELESMLKDLFEYVNPKRKILLDRIISKTYNQFKKVIGKKTLRHLANHKIDPTKKPSKSEELESNYNQIKNELYKLYLKKFKLTDSEVKLWCIDFLNKPVRERIEIIDNVLKFNITSEKKNRILLYLFLLGSYNKDLMVIILYRGDRSSGKSYIIKFVWKLFPKYDQVIANTMTDQSIKYDDSFTHRKMFLLREMFEDQKKLVEYIKSFWDSKEIIHKFTEKVGDSFDTRTKIQERLSIILTFSFENVQADLVDRSIVMTPDQSISQTTAILKNDVKRDNDSITRLFENDEIRKLRFLIGETVNYIDWKWDDVRIIFTDKFLIQMFPPKIPRKARRDKDKIKNLIKIITIWNFKHRKSLTLGNKRIIWAEYEDLEIALKYFEDLFHHLILDIDATKRLILKHVVKGDKYKITPLWQYVLTKGLDVSRGTIKNKLFDLVEKGYLDKKKLKGRWQFWKLKEFNIVENLDLNKEEIDDLVEQDYNFYANKTPEILREEKKERESNDD